jgi:4'-phosphopantetheinyl transferase
LTQSVSQSTRHSDVSFNVSHSGELALLAVGRGREVGIDIERMDAHTDMDALARRFLSEAERSCLASLEGPGRRAAFYRAWTSKEAYLKARGVGLSVPLDSFDVSFRPGAPPRLLASREVGAAVARWTLMELPTGPDYAAVLAIDGTPRTIRLWHWSPTTSSRERGSSSQYGAPADPA